MYGIKKEERDKDFNTSLERLGELTLRNVLEKEGVDELYSILKNSNLTPSRFFRDLMASIKDQANIFTKENAEKGIKPFFLRIHEHIYWDIGWEATPYNKRPDEQGSKDIENTMFTYSSNRVRKFFVSEKAKKDMEKMEDPFLEIERVFEQSGS